MPKDVLAGTNVEPLEVYLKSVEPQLKKYTDLTLKNDGSWLTSKGVELVKVHNGALVLEYNAGVEGIPRGLWYFYK